MSNNAQLLIILGISALACLALMIRSGRIFRSDETSTTIDQWRAFADQVTTVSFFGLMTALGGFAGHYSINPGWTAATGALFSLAVFVGPFLVFRLLERRNRK